MFRELTYHPKGHPCYGVNRKTTKSVPVPNLSALSIQCVVPPMPQFTSSCDVCCSTAHTMVNCGCEEDEPVEVFEMQYGTECPEGSMPIEIYTALNSPEYEAIWACYEAHEIAAVLDRYLCFHVCGCSGSQSVLLAASHFMQLHGQINPATLTAWVKQATKPTAVIQPWPEQILKSKYGSQHWALTSYGQHYQEIRKPAIALAGMAWGA